MFYSFADNDKENDNRSALATQAVILRRRKPKRRSTGVVHIDMDVSFYQKELQLKLDTFFIFFFNMDKPCRTCARFACIFGLKYKHFWVFQKIYL